MRHKGKITTWNDDKGFGFIKPFTGGGKVFIHIKAFGNRSDRPEVNDVVTYSVTKDKQGRTQAVNATRPGEKRTIKSGKQPSSFAIFFAVIFLAVVGASTFTTVLPLAVLIGYLILSAITYFIYAWDKASARAGRWRTSEGTLQLLALAGGWPGALIAQQTLRHKSKKASFRVTLWFAVLMNCAGLVWLHTPEGLAFLRLLQ
jgi:uncharacterized membrane protein YsdA (DUF1294 family)/cold shock CspA family protein